MAAQYHPGRSHFACAAWPSQAEGCSLPRQGGIEGQTVQGVKQAAGVAQPNRKIQERSMPRRPRRQSAAAAGVKPHAPRPLTPPCPAPALQGAGHVVRYVLQGGTKPQTTVPKRAAARGTSQPRPLAAHPPACSSPHLRAGRQPWRGSRRFGSNSPSARAAATRPRRPAQRSGPTAQAWTPPATVTRAAGGVAAVPDGGPRERGGSGGRRVGR